MKKIMLILATTLSVFATSCSNAADKSCEKDCKKECCAKEEKACEKDCKKACCAHKNGELVQLEIGAENPSLDVKMKDISGKEITLNQIAKENGLLVVFSCNTCPFVVGREGKSQGWENRYNEIKEWADKYQVGFILVNANEAKRDNDDSFEAMQKHALEAGYNGIYYTEDKNHVIADAYGAKTTPHVFLFDKQNKLVYKGAIDDNVDSKEEVKEKYLANALENLAAGKEINPSETRNLGCSIKRVK